MTNKSGPIYTLQLDIVGCIFEVRVNDVPLLRSAGNLPANTEIPLNEWIHAGSNPVSLLVRPPKGKPEFPRQASASAIVYKKDSGQPRATRAEEKKISGSLPKGNIAEHTIEDQIDAQVPFPRSIWFSAPSLQGREAQLLERTASVHRMLAAGDVDAFVSAVYTRETELAACYYQSLDQRISNIRHTMTWLTSRDSSRISPLPAKMTPELVGSGRLGRVLDSSGRDSAISFESIPNGFGAFVLLNYCLTAVGDLIVIR